MPDLPMDEIFDLMSATKKNAPKPQDGSDAVRREYRELREKLAIREIEQAADSQANDGAITRAGYNLPASKDSAGPVCGEQKQMPLPAEATRLLSSAHHAAVNTAAITGVEPVISGVFFNGGGDEMQNALTDPALRNRVFNAVLARHVTDNELVCQHCMSLMNALGPSVLAGSFKEENNMFQQLLRVKHRCEAAQRAAILVASRLEGGNGIRVGKAGQVNIGHVQQVQNTAVQKAGCDNGSELRMGTLPKKAKGA